MPKFLLKFQAAVIKEIPIEKTPLTIGRKTDNDIVIENLAVSGHHARITLQGTSYVIEDLQSTNGTFINDKRVVSTALKHEDAIIIGQHTLVFMYPESQAAAPAFDTEATIVMPPPSAAAVPPPAAAPAPAAPVIAAPPPAAPPAPEPAAPTAAPAAPPATPPASFPPQKQEPAAVLRVIEGKAEQNEYPLTGLLTYIGKSATAAIKIKGMFAPDIAALISKRAGAYLITAVKEDYPKLNNKALNGQMELKDGDIIEVGGIRFFFHLQQDVR